MLSETLAPENIVLQSPVLQSRWNPPYFPDKSKLSSLRKAVHAGQEHFKQPDHNTHITLLEFLTSVLYSGKYTRERIHLPGVCPAARVRSLVIFLRQQMFLAVSIN